MAGISTNVQMTGLVTTQLRRQFTPILRNKLQFGKFAVDGVITPKAGFNTLRWLQATDLGVFITALTEASTTENEVGTITITYIETTVANYGAFMKISDLADAMWSPEARGQFRDIFGFSAAKTVDTLIRNAGNATTNTYGARSNNTATALTSMINGNTARPEDLGYLAGFFGQNDSQEFDKIDGLYAVMINGKMEQDMKTYCSPVTTGAGKMEWWNLAAQTADGWGDLKRGYIATLLDCALFRTNNLTTVTVTGTVTCFKGFALADYGLGKCSLQNMEPDIIVKTSGPNDTSQPLNTFSTIGWKVRMGQKLIDANRVLAYYAAIA